MKRLGIAPRGGGGRGEIDRERGNKAERLTMGTMYVADVI